MMADAPVGVLEDIVSHSFPDVDGALEWCENRILERYGEPEQSLPEDLAIQELLGGLTREELALVEDAVELVHVSEGEVVFREGDHADAIYFVLSGLVSVRLLLVGKDRDRRLATLGPGVAVGEMAFLDEGERSADVVAERDSLLARLSIGDLHEIGEVAPRVTATFSANLARNLSGRLRRANEQVRMLARLSGGRGQSKRTRSSPSTARATRSPTSGTRSASTGTSTCTLSARSPRRSRRTESRK